MTESEWLQIVEKHKDKLRRFIDEWHPCSDGHSALPMPITAATPELARQNVLGSIKRTDPVREFDDALKTGKVSEIYKILDETWFGVPESTSCWRIPGFRESVDLMDDRPDDENTLND